MKKIRRIENENEGDGSLESPLTLLHIAKEAVTRVNEMLRTYIGIGCRKESLKIQMEFPPERQDEENHTTTYVSSIPFQITSDGVTVKSTLSFSEVVGIGLELGLIEPDEVEEVNETNRKNNKN